uniref:Uncharacterized protein n=1 Tax=Octopus bimaculoides TaxID=37653 RepID=A0A0L8HVL3_OCTBM
MAGRPKLLLGHQWCLEPCTQGKSVSKSPCLSLSYQWSQQEWDIALQAEHSTCQLYSATSCHTIFPPHLKYSPMSHSSVLSVQCLSQFHRFNQTNLKPNPSHIIIIKCHIFAT